MRNRAGISAGAGKGVRQQLRLDFMHGITRIPTTHTAVNNTEVLDRIPFGPPRKAKYDAKHYQYVKAAVSL